MYEFTNSETVVIGVGNTIFSDDGLGVHAANLLRDDPRVPPAVSVLDGGTLGLDLIGYACDVPRVLFLDAMNTGKPPGTLGRRTAPELLGCTAGWSAHQLGLADLLSALALVSKIPQEIVVLGLQPEITDWGTTMSPRVQGSLPQLVEAAVAQLRAWHGPESEFAAGPQISDARLA